MNYHIMVQDKFLDSYIEDVYAIGEEQNNIFLFRGQENDTNYVNTTRKIEYIGNDKKAIKERLKSIKSTDAIFVHWYDMWISEVLFDLPNKIYVMIWGGEFYCEPFWHHQWVYDKITLQNVKKQLKYPRIKFTLNPLSLLRQAKRTYFFKKDLNLSYALKNKYVGRIDFLICLDKNDLFYQDYHKIKELYPAFRAKNVAGFYDQNFDRAQQISREKVVNSQEINILVGNSANAANNHLDAFEKLKDISNIVVICPLSYGGSKNEVEKIIEQGKQIFKDRFIPITNFMGRDEYVNFLNTIDIVFMYHNRQQAFGNICTVLSLGKPVFLKYENAVKGYLDAMGIKIYEANTIDKIDLNRVIEESQDSLEKNIELLKANISEDRRLADLKNVLKSTY
jgi:dTDP-N-acetylfucosamine:lipid II N-acetylfucosaminyltransferase